MDYELIESKSKGNTKVWLFTKNAIFKVKEMLLGFYYIYLYFI